MARIIVTGGAGFIGSTLSKRLFSCHSSDFDELIVIDNLTYAGSLQNLSDLKTKNNFIFRLGNISNFQFLLETIQDYDLIFHLAAESHVDRSIKDGLDFWRTNVIGTTNILEVMRLRTGVRLIYVSTDEVYGSIAKGSFSEDSQLRPSSPYSASKAAGDLACLAYLKTHGLDVLITRCSNNFGPNQHSEKFLPVIIQSIAGERPIPLYGNGSNVREWIPAWVHSEYLIQLMFSGISGKIFNIGSGFEKSNLEMIELVSSILGKKAEIEFVKDRKAHDFRYSISMEKLLSFVPEIRYDFNSELTKTIYSLM